jgi:hypothetical protein
MLCIALTTFISLEFSMADAALADCVTETCITGHMQSDNDAGQPNNVAECLDQGYCHSHTGWLPSSINTVSLASSKNLDIIARERIVLAQIPNSLERPPKTSAIV